MKRSILLAGVMAFFGVHVHAGVPLVPPKKYNHPYNGPMDIRVIDRENVWEECSHGGTQKMRPDVAGCSSVRKGVCVIHLAKYTKRAPIASILIHEIAHCNGWRHK